MIIIACAVIIIAGSTYVIDFIGKRNVKPRIEVCVDLAIQQGYGGTEDKEQLRFNCNTGAYPWWKG